MIKVNLGQLSTDIQAASVLMPQLAAAYAAYRAIWAISHPGQTEEDYLSHLDDLSKKDISAADAILIADGFVQDAKGGWAKPAAVGA